MDRHIFVIGMPGCGKSSLSKKVASNMGLNYVDTDSALRRPLAAPRRRSSNATASRPSAMPKPISSSS